MKWIWFKRKREPIISSPTGLQEQDLLNAIKEAHEELLAAHAKIEEYKWLENALRRRTWELNERVKELRCLYALSVCLNNSKLTLEQILDSVVKEIPQGWQNPKATCVRLIIKGKEYKSPNFHQTKMKQTAFIYNDDKQIGILEIYLLPESMLNCDQPFLSEEQKLLKTITLLISEIVTHRKLIEQNLQKLKGTVLININQKS